MPGATLCGASTRFAVCAGEPVPVRVGHHPARTAGHCRQVARNSGGRRDRIPDDGADREPTASGQATPRRSCRNLVGAARYLPSAVPHQRRSARSRHTTNRASKRCLPHEVDILPDTIQGKISCCTARTRTELRRVGEAAEATQQYCSRVWPFDSCRPLDTFCSSPGGARADQQRPRPRSSERELTRWLKAVNESAQGIDDLLRTQFIGGYEIAALYVDWQVDPSAFERRLSVNISESGKGSLTKRFGKFASALLGYVVTHGYATEVAKYVRSL